MGELTVYRASAGSGKTFRLTIEYLKILIKNPSNYKNILAITFTNKATEEMKVRILKELHSLALGEKNAYFEILQNETQLPETKIQQHAAIAEKNILHDYGHFSVMTIDAFFQIVVKSFARELNLSRNYDVELDTQTIQELALDKLFSELDTNTALRKWLKAFIEEKLQDGKSWNITRDILELSKELFSERLYFLDRDTVKKWSNKDFMHTYNKELDTIIFAYRKKMQTLGKQALEKIKEQMLTVSDFAYGSKGVAGFLQKLANGTIETALSTRAIKVLDNPENFYTKKTPIEVKDKIDTIAPFLQEVLIAVETLLSEEKTTYTTSLKIKKNIHVVGIFADIARHIYTLLQDNNKMLLSESNKLLHEMIANNEVPFIYEKIGSRYHYFLWDEFQDTSQIQWANMQPLLANAIASANPCLIVGDIKQAIYRWRSGDWDILQNQVKKIFPTSTELFLQENWRSSGRIITFNNALYSLLPSLLEKQLGAEGITTLYADATQKQGNTDNTENGYIQLYFPSDTETDSAEDLCIKKTIDTVVELQQKGVAPQDIVLLVRTHQEALTLTSTFLDIDQSTIPQDIVLDFISEESLYLTASLTVRIIEIALWYYQTQEKYYEITLEHLSRYLDNGNTLFQQWVNYTKTNKQTLKSVSQLVAECIQIFGLTEKKNEQLFLLAIEEEIFEYETSHSGNIGAFLSWWETRRTKAVITPGNTTSAIRIYTIHKSKGLEFEHVIIPFANQPLEKTIQNNRFWATPSESPFNNIEKVLLSYEKSLEDTLFKNEYLAEKKNQYIDLINTIYVATTRAKQSLHLYFPKKKRTGIGNLLELYIQENPQDSFWYNHYNQKENNWQYGSISNKTIEVKTTSPIPQKITIETYINNNTLLTQLSNISNHFPKDSQHGILTTTPLTQGNLWHDILASIYTIDDIPVVIKRHFYKGLLSIEECNTYISHLQKLLSKKELVDYYSSKYSIQNERTILIDGKKYIPDRVVFNEQEIIILEYKFGEKENPQYQKQVTTYKHFFQEYKQQTVKAFLVYGILDKIIEL